MMKSATLAAALALGLAGTGVAAPPLALDTVTTIGDVEVACTGVGQTRNDPKWQAYPVRIEFSNSKNEYMAPGEVVVSDARGHEVVRVGCDGPWLLMKLQPGAYSVEARLPDTTAKPRTAPFNAPTKGQLRVVLQFPDL